MRERIKVGLCKEFTDGISLPGLYSDFEHAFHEMIDLNKAFGLMLCKQGIIKVDDAKKILAGLDYAEENITRDSLDPQQEDMYFNVESKMIEKAGRESGGRLHTGRSRNDVFATQHRMEVRNSIIPVLDALISFQELVLQKARENVDVVITGYTHFQAGQPITYGHWLTAVSSAFLRDFKRIKAAFENTNQSPYGCAAAFGTTFPIDRQVISDYLGFDNIIENSLDAVGSREYIPQLEAAYAIMMTNVSRFSEDMYIWATNEFSTIKVGGEIAICSSIMPQKMNPCSLEYAKGKTGSVIGLAAGSMATLKDSPYTNTVEAFEALTLYWDCLTQTKVGFDMLKQTIKYTTVNKKRAYENAATNYCTVTGLADFMVQKFGISFKNAHDIVGDALAILDEKGENIKNLTCDLVKSCCKKYLGDELPITEEEVDMVLDPAKNVQSKVSVGGPQKSSVLAMIEHEEAQVKADKAWLEATKKKLADAKAKLLADEAALLAK